MGVPRCPHTQSQSCWPLHSCRGSNFNFVEKVGTYFRDFLANLPISVLLYKLVLNYKLAKWFKNSSVYLFCRLGSLAKLLLCTEGKCQVCYRGFFLQFILLVHTVPFKVPFKVQNGSHSVVTDRVESIWWSCPLNTKWHAWQKANSNLVKFLIILRLDCFNKNTRGEPCNLIDIVKQLKWIRLRIDKIREQCQKWHQS